MYVGLFRGKTKFIRESKDFVGNRETCEIFSGRHEILKLKLRDVSFDCNKMNLFIEFEIEKFEL